MRFENKIKHWEAEVDKLKLVPLEKHVVCTPCICLGSLYALDDAMSYALLYKN